MDISDIEAIDPMYYKNLKNLLDNSLESLGLEGIFTFTAEQTNFGVAEVSNLFTSLIS